MTSLTVQTHAAVGMSVGSSTLAAVAGRVVTGAPVVNRAGHPVGDFVHRVGDPLGVLAADGSLHAGADLLAEALLMLARKAAAGRPLPPAVAVAYPGHWGPTSVAALRRGLRRLPPWSCPGARLDLLADYAAAAAGMVADLPGRGVAAVCDFGSAGTTVALVDLDGFAAIGTPLRLTEFSGDTIDRALLTHVRSAAGITHRRDSPAGTATAAIEPLTRLRADCRAAKERLSAHTVTAVPGLGAGLRGDIRLTRPELDDLIRSPLACVPEAVRELLRRNHIAAAELAAVLSVGGGAAIASVSTTLSRHLRVPVITPAQPALAAATGAARQAAGPGEQSATEAVPVRPRPAPAALAWSAATDIPALTPGADVPTVGTPARPRLDFDRAPAPREYSAPVRAPWCQRPLLVASAVMMVIAGAGGATALALRSDAGVAPAPSAQLPMNPTPGGPSASAPAEQQSNHHADDQHGGQQ